MRRGRTPVLASRAAVTALLVLSLPYLAWRLGWSHRGAHAAAWAALLVLESVVLLRLLLGCAARRRSPRPTPAPSRWAPRGELVVVVSGEPLLLVRMCLRSCRGVVGAERVRVLDLADRADVESLCRRTGVELVRAGDHDGVAGALDHVLAATTSPVVGLVPASVVVLPNLLRKAAPLLAEAGTGAVSVPAAPSAVPGIVGGAGYPLDCDADVGLAAALDARDAALPLHGPVLFAAELLRSLDGFVPAGDRVALATAVRLQRHGVLTRVEREPLALSAAPWSEGEALRARGAMAGGRARVLRRTGWRAVLTDLSGWQRAPHVLAALELWSSVVRLGVVVLVAACAVAAWIPLTVDRWGLLAGLPFWTAAAAVGRSSLPVREPWGGRLRRGFRVLSVDLRALARRGSATGGTSSRSQLVVVGVLLASCLAAGLSTFVGPAADRLPDGSHGVLLAAALVLAWLARDTFFAAEDRQRRALPRARVLPAPPDRSGGVTVRSLSPHGLDVTAEPGLAEGDVLEFRLRLPVGAGRTWDRTVRGVVEREVNGSAYVALEVSDDERDEILHFCAVTAPMFARTGLVPAPVVGVRRTGVRQDGGRRCDASDLPPGGWAGVSVGPGVAA